MGKYKFIDKVDKNKIFIVTRKEIEGRIDPNQYHFERTESINKLKKNNEITKLKNVVKNVKTNTSLILDTDIYIGLENIKSDSGEYLQSKDKQSISSAGIFKKGQILFPKLRPYLNKVYYSEFDGICSTEFHIFESNSMSNEFLSIYLRSSLIVNQTKHLMTGNTLPRLQTEDIENLPVPILKTSTQQKIVGIYKDAFVSKQNKEKEAKDLLASIDTYLMSELGITLPQQDDSLASKIFNVPFSDISGLRLDPEMTLYSQKISKSKYPLTPLGHLLKSNPQYGANEAGIKRVNADSPRYIRITDIDSNGFLKKGLGKTAEVIEEKYFLNDKDILFARSGNTVGKTYIHHKNKVEYQCFFAGYMIRIVVDENKILPDFLFAYTQTKPYHEWVKAIQRSAGQPNINAEEYKSFNIPLPPINKQREIANYINELRTKVKLLQQEAKADFKLSKQNIEQQILGGK